MVNEMKHLAKSFFLLLCLFSLIITLTSCKEKYERIDHINYNEIFKVKESKYYVFVYRPGCTICPLIEDDVFAYYKKAKRHKDMPNLYALNKGDTVNNGGIACSEKEYVDFVGATSYKEIHTYSSPYLFLIEDGVVTKTFDGKTVILEELNK